MEKQSLINLGLTEGEAKVYLALLKLGSSTVGPIVKEANIAYSNIYEILNRLLEKGLISFIIKEKTKHFQASQPSQLYEYLEKKESELKEEKFTLKKLIPELEKLKSLKENQEAEIFLGFKGLKTAYERLTEEYKKEKKELLFFYVEKNNKKAEEFYQRRYSKFKEIRVKGIADKEFKKSEFIKKTNFSMKYVNFPIPGNIDIYKDRVLIISWGATPIGILITSRDISQKFREYFYSI